MLYWPTLCPSTVSHIQYLFLSACVRSWVCRVQWSSSAEPHVLFHYCSYSKPHYAQRSAALLDHCLDGLLIVFCPLFSLMLFHKCSVLLHQCIRKRRITRRVSARASSALLQWPSSSASCSSQPIRCCGMVWSSPAHCEPCWPLLRNMHQKLHFLLVGRAGSPPNKGCESQERVLCFIFISAIVIVSDL